MSNNKVQGPKMNILLFELWILFESLDFVI